MGQIVRRRAKDMRPGDAIIDGGGRMMFRLPDSVLNPLTVAGGMTPVCDTSGNPMLVPGYVVMTGVVLDDFDNLICPQGIVTLPRWQASVN